MISGSLTPLRTMWILGDAVIDKLGPHINNIIQNSPEELYLTHNYDLTCYTIEDKQGFLSNNFIIRIANSLITGMNSVQYAMPSVIVVVLDNKYLREEYFGDKQLPKLVENLLVRMNEVIWKRKRQLTFPYWEENQPRMVFIRPTPRPAFSMADPDKYKNIK